MTPDDETLDDGMTFISPEEAERLEQEEEDKRARPESPQEKKKRLKEEAKAKIAARLQERRKLRKAMRGGKRPEQT